MHTIWKATQSYEGRRQETIRAFTEEKAKALIRNHVHLNEPAEWEEMDRHGRDGFVLTNAGSDYEVKVKGVRVHGDPSVLLEGEGHE